MSLPFVSRGPMFILRLLGGLTLEGPSGPVSGRVAQRRRLGLLALLGAAGEKGLSRDKLAGYLWPETDESNAKHRLSDSLHVLRKELGEESILASGDFLRLNAEVVECDVRAFEAALEGKRFEDALSFYAGPFLDGFYLGGEGEFDAWVESERQRLAERYATALEAAADEAQAAGDPKRAVEWWKQLAAYDPLNSRVILRLMEALAAAVDPANALEILRVHELRLRDELGLELPEELRTFAERLRAETVAGPAGIGAPAQPAFPIAESVRVGPAREAPTPSVKSSGWRWVVAAVVVVVLGSLGIVRNRAVTAWKRVPLDRDAVAVMPFRVTAADPALSSLDEGILDLLYAILNGDVGPRAIEPNALLLAWHDRQSRGDAESADAPLRLAAHFGAGQLLEGALVEAGPEVTVNAWLRRVPDGETLARHTVTGSPDSIHILVHRLAVGLMGSRLGERAERLASLEGRSSQAIEAYLAGTRAHREGKYGEAIRLLDRAIELDSTLALAGLRMAEAGDLAVLSGGRGASRRGLHFAAPLRGTLSRRDRAAVTALMSMTTTDTVTSLAGRLEAVRAWLELAPDDALAWRRYAEVLRQSGSVIGIPNWEREARRAFERAWALDSTTAAAVEDHLQTAVWTEDIEWLRRVGPRYLAVADTSGDYWTANRWVIALALGDSATVRELRARARAGNLREPWPVLFRLWTAGRTLGSPQVRGDEELLRSQFRSQLATDSFWYSKYEVEKGIETGRLRHVAEMLAGPWGRFWGSGRFGPSVFVIDYWLLYPGFDSLVTVVFDSLRSYTALPVPRSRRANHQSSEALRSTLLVFDCYVQLYRAGRGDTVGVREAVRRLYPLYREWFAEGTCPALVEAMVEAQDHRREESPALDRLEALLRAGNYEWGVTPAVPFLARQRRLRGEFERGLAVARMRALGWSFYSQMRPALFKEEGDLAAIVGDTAGAIDAYTRYLNLRTDPDPELRPQVDSVRMALERLQRGKE